MNKAIFIDRDGTINYNKELYYIWKADDFQLNPGVAETLSALKERAYKLIVISNQGGISRGEYRVKDVEDLHHHMRSILKKEGVTLDEIYYCPHHHTREACLCRKPLPLMIEKALARYGIDSSLSYFIGDSERDVEAGKAAGLKSILIESNSDLRQVLDQID